MGLLIGRKIEGMILIIFTDEFLNPFFLFTLLKGSILSQKTGISLKKLLQGIHFIDG